jgi:hypothetical protein
MTTSLPRRTLLFATALTFAALSLPVGAQSGGSHSVDFIALTADGAPISDLAAGQITLKVGGRARKVTSLEFVPLDAHSNVLPAPFATNSGTDSGRDFVVVVDEESIPIGAETPVKQVLTAFASRIPARDRLGFFTVPRGSQALAPTTDRAAFKAAIAGVQGRMSRTSAANSGCHGRDVLSALSSIVTRNSRPSGPTAVVFFSSGITAPDTSVSKMVAGGTDQMVLESQTCKLTQREFQALGTAVDAARAHLYVVRADDGGRSEGLESLVGVTSGQMMAIGGTSDDAMVRIGKQLSGYYVATFETDDADRSGASHRLELASTRPDVTVRGRSSVTIPKAEKQTPQNLLRTAAVQTGFGLRALAVASRNDGDAKNAVKLVGLAEPTDPSVKINAAAAGVYDTTGKLVGQWTARPEDLQRTPFAAALVVPTGTYRVRVAAVDTLGRAATADYDLNTEMVSAGVATLGGMLVGTASPNFAPRLQFSTEPEVMVYFELYGRPEGQFEAIVELSDSADGRALAAVQPTPSATGIADKFLFTAKLPISALKPGDYVVRAKITFVGQAPGILRRTIRKK